mgnify:CR=1 FL=1
MEMNLVGIVDMTFHLLRFVSEGWELPTSIIFDAERSLFTMLLFKLASLEEDAIDRSMLLSIKDDVSELISAIHLVAQTALSEKWISTAAAVCPMFLMLPSVYQDAFANAHLYV